MQDRMEWNDYVASFSAGGSNPLREVYSELQISLKNDDEIDGNGGGYYDSIEEAIENILKDNASQKVTASNQVEEVRNFENGDGYITYEEAYWTFKLSEGKVDLFADINKLDLSKIKASDFPGGVGSDQVFNLASKYYFTSFEQALVYGNITLRLLPGNMVIAHSDTYNFDIKNQPGTFWRDVFTGIGYMYNGYGKPFQIHFTGIAQINP